MFLVVEGIFPIELFPFPNFLFSTTPQLFNFPKRRFTLNLTLFYFKVFVCSSLAYSHSNFFVITFWKHKELRKEKFFCFKEFFLLMFLPILLKVQTILVCKWKYFLSCVFGIKTVEKKWKTLQTNFLLLLKLVPIRMLTSLLS